MAIDYRVLPIKLINDYIWDLASGNVSGVEAIPVEIWDTNQYSTAPFFPIHENQSSGLSSSPNPFVLYDYLFEDMHGTMYELKCERAIFTIVASSPEQLYAIKNYIQDNLNKLDETAKSINKHINNDSIRFKYVKCTQDLFVMQELKQTERSFAPKFASTLGLYYDYTRS